MAAKNKLHCSYYVVILVILTVQYPGRLQFIRSQSTWPDKQWSQSMVEISLQSEKSSQIVLDLSLNEYHWHPGKSLQSWRQSVADPAPVKWINWLLTHLPWIRHSWADAKDANDNMVKNKKFNMVICLLTNFWFFNELNSNFQRYLLRTSYLCIALTSRQLCSWFLMNKIGKQTTHSWLNIW